MTRTTALVCAALVSSGVIGCASGSAAPTRPSSPSSPAATTDLLRGSWDTGPIPLRKLRSSLLANGYSKAKVRALFKQFGWSKAAEFKIVFYRDGNTPFLARKGWDPSKGTEPGDADHGPYSTRPDHRFVARGVDPPTDRNREVWSYKVGARQLLLRVVSLSEPGFSRADEATDLMLLRASSARAYKRVQ